MLKLKPYKKYIDVDYDYVKQLPDGWQLLPNIAVFEERIERGHETEELLSVTIGKGVIKQTDVDIKKDSSNEDKSKYKLIKIGDIAYNKMRMWQGALGYSNYQGITSPAYVILKPKMKINSRFFHYMFRTIFYTNYSKRFSYGIVDDQLSLRYTDFKRMYSIIPPFEVQNAIVGYLDKKTTAIDKFIRNKERLIDLLEEQRRGFLDRTINQKFEHLTVKKPLKYLAKLVSEQVKIKCDNDIYLALDNIESWTGKIDLSIQIDEFESSAKRFKNSDILFNKLRPYLAKVVIPEFNGVCVGELLVLRPSKELTRNFLFYKLISQSFIDYINSTSYGTKMPRANWGTIGKVEIVLPREKKMQENIVSIINEEEKRINISKKKIENEILKIQEFREALVTNIIIGKQKVP